MNDKKKITLIYAGVALISVLILGMSFFLASLKREQRKQADPATDVGKVEFEGIALERDMEMEREDGSRVKISALDDKVWLAVQFYAACPMCAQRNQAYLREVYEKFRNEEEFLVVCLSVDPADDTEEKIDGVRDVLSADSKNWWFLKEDRDALWDYMENVMFFTTIKERTDPIHIAEKGRWAHDMGIHLYRGDTLVHKWHEGLPPEQLDTEIREALTKLRAEKSES